MDPVSALSLAVNVITVVDTAVKAGKAIYDLYESTSGFSKQTQHLIDAIAGLDNALATLDDAQTKISLPTSPATDRSTSVAVEKCRQTMREINAILDRCRVSKRRSVVQATRGWFRSNLKYGARLAELLAELESAERQLRVSLEIAARVEVGRVRKLMDSTDRKQAELDTRLQAISDSIAGIDDNTRLLRALKDSVILTEASMNLLNHSAVLHALRPQTADKRFDEIRDPAAGSFAWLLRDHATEEKFESDRSGTHQDDEVDDDIDTGDAESEEDPKRQAASHGLRTWLKEGSSVFHFVGKPGSGKSTLMKYLATHNTTRNLLQEWAEADNKQLIFSAFFFWKPGTDEQKTMRGLRRGILHGVLSRDPDVTKMLFPEYWSPKAHFGPGFPAQMSAFSISDGQVKAAFDQMLACQGQFANYKVCLFIDGLDEFEEPDESHWRFSQRLYKWTADCTNVKLCTSSRDYPSILQSFPSAQQLTLHNLTRPDIEAVVLQRLRPNQHFQALMKSEPPASRRSSFTWLVTENAEGVFLWAVLVLKWVEEELAAGVSSWQPLVSLVNTMPPELDGFISKILESIPRAHVRETWFVFAMMLRAHGYFIAKHQPRYMPWSSAVPEVYTMGLSFILDTFARHGYHSREPGLFFLVPPTISGDERRRRESETSPKLRSWCRGLAEIAQTGSNPNVVFTHRSVPEFLSSILQESASKHGLDDDWVMDGFLTVILAEHNQEPGVPVRLIDETLYDPTAHLFQVTRLARPETPESKRRFFAKLDHIDNSTQRWRGNSLTPAEYLDMHFNETVDYVKLSRKLPSRLLRYRSAAPLWLKVIAESEGLGLTDYIVWKLKESRVLNDSLGQLFVLTIIGQAAAPRIKWPGGDWGSVLRIVLDSGISPNAQPSQIISQYPAVGGFYTEKTGKRGSAWRESLVVYIYEMIGRRKGCVSEATWNELGVWLEHGAQVPVEVMLIPQNPGDSVRGHFLVGYKFQSEKMETLRYRMILRSKLNFSGDCFWTLKSTTLGSMIRWHKPKSMAALLEKVDAGIALADDQQEWEQLRVDEGCFVAGRILQQRFPDAYALRKRIFDDKTVMQTRVSWSWNTDIRHWVPDLEEYASLQAASGWRAMTG
ncbi:hypothetical protein B0T14DRAFT_146331 [Immersiella caudata]|uniref:NACHT domain-containing protein n=1 Tax=Immersiella caudata TaxID=314043 RepID=A0AA39X691_9PEZI|nr:hypothetical protein B0T14DRAFT_146331 [Immersiella caudata]